MKILILRLSSLGDIVLTQPIAAWLRAHYPEAQIDFLVKQQYSEIVSLMGHGLRPIVYQKSLAFHLGLRHETYDLVLDLHGKLSTFLVRLAARGSESVVYHKARAKRKRIVRGDKTLSITSTLDLYKTALEKISREPSLEYPRLYPAQNPQLLELPEAEKLILIFPGAKHDTKRYPANYYKELLKISPRGYQYVILGSPSERELAARISAESSALNLCGDLSFSELLGLIELSDWVVSSDSGPMHLAAALQKPQIAIFGATHPRLGFAPLNPKARILCADLDCQPCSLHGSASCPEKHFKCMHSISVKSILNILIEA